MKTSPLLLFVPLFLTLTACAETPARSDDYVYTPSPRPYLPVEVSVFSDNQGSLPQYPVNGDASHYRAYLQAANNERYRIKVNNSSGQRVGVVVAVDGRNIISGQKSYLQNSERMYILNPYSFGEYEGWRTTASQVNRFYFTAPENSYAAAWGDNSAMGVIAVAVFPEVQRPPMEMSKPKKGFWRWNSTAPSPDSKSNARMESEAAGTGYGEKHYSPTMAVNFEPQAEAMEKVYLKYEWRETLCKKGIASACSAPVPPPQPNRFWPEDNQGFAPPPPRRY